MAMKLYVGGLSFNTDEEELKQLFTQIGEVISCHIIRDRDTGQSRGFAFVEMTSDAEARQAIAQLNGYDLDGRSLTVNEAREKRERGGGGGGRGRFGGGRGGGGGGRRF
jgi:RNA recognition motif-containing protein